MKAVSTVLFALAISSASSASIKSHLKQTDLDPEGLSQDLGDIGNFSSPEDWWEDYYSSGGWYDSYYGENYGTDQADQDLGGTLQGDEWDDWFEATYGYSWDDYYYGDDYEWRRAQVSDHYGKGMDFNDWYYDAYGKTWDDQYIETSESSDDQDEPSDDQDEGILFSEWFLDNYGYPWDYEEYVPPDDGRDPNRLGSKKNQDEQDILCDELKNNYGYYMEMCDHRWPNGPPSSFIKKRAQQAQVSESRGQLKGAEQNQWGNDWNWSITSNGDSNSSDQGGWDGFGWRGEQKRAQQDSYDVAGDVFHLDGATTGGMRRAQKGKRAQQDSYDVAGDVFHLDGTTASGRRRAQQDSYDVAGDVFHLDR